MAQESYLRNILSKYTYLDIAKRDVCAAIHQYRNLKVKFDTYVFKDGKREELACLNGTIPIMFKGCYYHIPVCIWLLDSYPYNSPICYVKPTSNMVIRASRQVDYNGRVYLPYLQNWCPDSSDLLGVIQLMIIAFEENPPVFTKPKSPSHGACSTPYPTEPSKDLQLNKIKLEQRHSKTSNLHLEALSKDFEKLLDDHLNSDVEVICDNRTFKVHRIVLSARSEVFAKMLNSKMVNGTAGQIRVENCEVPIFKSFLHYLYSGKVPTLNLKTAKQLYKISDKYGVLCLRRACSEFLTNHLNDDIAYEILILAHQRFDDDFRKNVISYMIDRKILPQGSLWFDFCKKHFYLANEIMLLYKQKHCPK